MEGEEILDRFLGQATLCAVAPHLGQVLLPPGQHLVQVEVPAHVTNIPVTSTYQVGTYLPNETFDIMTTNSQRKCSHFYSHGFWQWEVGELRF